MSSSLTPHLPVSVRLEAVSSSGGEIHPGVTVESEGVTAGVHLDVGPVRRDDPDLTIALHLDTPSVDALRDGDSQSQDYK